MKQTQTGPVTPPPARHLYIVKPIFVSGGGREHGQPFIIDGATPEGAANAAVGAMALRFMLRINHVEFEVSPFVEMKDTIGLSINRAVPPFVFEIKRDEEGEGDSPFPSRPAGMFWVDGVRPVTR